MKDNKKSRRIKKKKQPLKKLSVKNNSVKKFLIQNMLPSLGESNNNLMPTFFDSIKKNSINSVFDRLIIYPQKDKIKLNPLGNTSLDISSSFKSFLLNTRNEL